MIPSRWGAICWSAFHLFAVGYPEAPIGLDMRTYENFYKTFGMVLPCAECSQHYAENLKKMPLTEAALSSREKLFAWTVNFHNAVNTALSKPQFSLADAVRKFVDNKVVLVDRPNMAPWMIVTLLTIALVFLLLKRR